jgi:hypothetical protein
MQIPSGTGVAISTSESGAFQSAASLMDNLDATAAKWSGLAMLVGKAVGRGCGVAASFRRPSAAT